MKKMMLLITLMGMMVSVVNAAATELWSNTGATSGASSIGNYTAGNSFTLQLQVTLPDTFGLTGGGQYPFFAGIDIGAYSYNIGGQRNTANNYFTIQRYEDSASTGRGNNPGANISFSTFAGKTVSMTLQYNKDAAAGQKLSFYVDTTFIAHEATGWTIEEPQTLRVSIGQAIAAGEKLPNTTFGLATVYDGIVDPVPEPTSLALLALGVAALGLRRRVNA